MAHIVVLGAGIGGLPMALEMREKARSEDRVTVISNTPNFHFVPSNPWVAVNWRSRKDIELPIRPILERKKINFIDVGARRVYPEESCIGLENGDVIEYDYLVIATGPKLAFDDIEGVGPDGHTHSICHVDHAVASSAAWQKFVSDPGPIVVGAVQGASCFGPAYEFAMIMDTDLSRRRIRDKVSMTFVTAEPYIGHLGLGGVGDSRRLIESAMRDRHIKWICNARVDRVEEGTMHVTELNKNGSEKEKHALPFKYSMLLPAFRGVDAVFGIEGLTNSRGFVAIDEYQRNPRYKNIFSVGVCVAIPPVEPTPVPIDTPKTGYMIESMAAAAARNIRALLDGRSPAEKATWNAVCLADFGDTGVAFVALPQIPPRNVNWFSEGKWVHLAKLAFEKYFMRKIRKGHVGPVFETLTLKALGISKTK